MKPIEFWKNQTKINFRVYDASFKQGKQPGSYEPYSLNNAPFNDLPDVLAENYVLALSTKIEGGFIPVFDFDNPPTMSDLETLCKVADIQVYESSKNKFHVYLLKKLDLQTYIYVYKSLKSADVKHLDRLISDGECLIRVKPEPKFLFTVEGEF